MGECSEGEPFRPIGLKVIDEHTEVLFNFLVDSFGLSIGLGMKGGRGVTLDLKKIIEVLHEF